MGIVLLLLLLFIIIIIHHVYAHSIVCIIVIVCACLCKPSTPYPWGSVPLPACLCGDECVIPLRFSANEKFFYLFIYTRGGISGKIFF